MTLVIRADAGPNIGTGHVMRTLALGQAWKRIGGTVVFVGGELPSGLIARIQAENFDVYKLDNSTCDSNDAKETAEIASSLNADWIATDGYRFDDTYQSILSQSNCRLMVIDDYQHARHENADLIVNQNAYADPTSYRTTSHAKTLTGPSFALLRHEFTSNSIKLSSLANTSQTQATKHIVKQARRILVTFGGEDADNWTLKSLKVLSDLNRKQLIVDCVVGACYQHGRELEVFKKTANMSLRVHRNLDHMAALMHRVDVAISAGGSTCYELARCGVPTIVASIADNQIPVALALSKRGVMLSIDEIGTGAANRNNDPMKRLSKSIRRLLNDYETRKTMSELGTELVDGNGGHRIATQMASMLFSFRDLTDPNTTLWIVEDRSQKPVGQIRFDHRDANTGVISVILDQAVRGRGLGKHLITIGCQTFFDTTTAQEVIAQIKPGNVASERAFRGAGFDPIQPIIVNGKIANQFVLAKDDKAENRGSQPMKRSA